ncbi:MULTISPECIES: hypothetical protein [Streptomyces]|uniref:hypothetical protein n=1 Tax=Streptomyces TaxID=1883 RepID=UPI003461142C
MTGIDVRRAQRWFWTLTAVAVLATGVLYQSLRATASPVTGTVVAVSALVLAASAVQAARILTVLAGPPRLPRLRRRRHRTASGSAASGHRHTGRPPRAPSL